MFTEREPCFRTKGRDSARALPQSNRKIVIVITVKNNYSIIYNLISLNLLPIDILVRNLSFSQSKIE